MDGDRRLQSYLVKEPATLHDPLRAMGSGLSRLAAGARLPFGVPLAYHQVVNLPDLAVIPAVAHLLSPPRTLAELQQPATRTESVLQVATARVVFANYDLLCHDFPQLLEESFIGTHPEVRTPPPARCARAFERSIDRWLLANAAVISRQQ